MLTVGSLFTGIGGLDLGLERAGMNVRWQSEVDPYCCRVLAKHWPNTPNLGDVRNVDWSTVERVDVICGGYPCQPFSLAGARAGESDARHLWPFFADALRHLRPRYALLENVPGHLSLGFGRVLGDLAELGFDAEWDCIPASSVGAPHLRYRVFVVAYSRSNAQWHAGRSGSPEPQGGRVPSVFGAHGTPRPVADADRERQPQSSGPVGEVGGRLANGGAQEDVADAARLAQREPSDQGQPVAGGGHARPEPGRGGQPGHPPGRAAESDFRGMDHGFSAGLDGGHWDAEWPGIPRTADNVKDRADRLRALGNAVVPQVAEWIGRRILEEDYLLADALALPLPFDATEEAS